MSSTGSYGAPETRDAILAATRAVLADQGGALKIGDVARAAGVSRQAVYLHFGDRAGLLVGLVQHMDVTLNLGPALEAVRAAESGAELIDRAMALHASFSAAIDPVAAILEAEEHRDADLGSAWRDRMRYRRQAHLGLVRRIAELGDLTPALDAEVVADLFYAVTLPSVWRECVRGLGWTTEAYIERFAVLLRRTLLAAGD